MLVTVLIVAAGCVSAPAPTVAGTITPSPAQTVARTITPTPVPTSSALMTAVPKLSPTAAPTPSGLQVPWTLTAPNEQCDDLGQQMKAALVTKLEPQAGPLVFTVPNTSKSVVGCSVSVEGTFADFPIDRVEPLTAMVLAQGFVVAPYPSTTVNAYTYRFRRGDQMIILDVSYDSTAPCPAPRLPRECSGNIARLGWYQESPSAQATPSSPSAAPSYIQDGCAPLGKQVAAALATGLPVSALVDSRSEWHLVDSAPTIGCTVSVKGLEAGNFPNGATGPLAAMLLAQGFERDDRFSADGPNGNARGYRKGYEVRILSYSWQVPPESCVHIGFNCYAPPEVTVITLGMRWYRL